MHATFLKQNDFYTQCAKWHVFLLSINVNKNENTNHFLYFFKGAGILFQKAYEVSNGKPMLPREADVNIDQCGYIAHYRLYIYEAK